MGRAMLIFVILMTTIFAGVLINLNNKLSEMPTVLVRNTLMREAENVSDFALRNAIRNANSAAFLNYHLGTPPFTDDVHHTQVFTDYKVGNCIIDSLQYSFYNDEDHYEVGSYVRGELQGIKVGRSAKMAFDYPFQGLSSRPNVLYLEMERLILTGLLKALSDFITWLIPGAAYNNDVTDTSGNNHTTTIYSEALLAATIPWGGAYSRYCVPFLGGYEGWFDLFGATHMVVARDTTVANPIQTDSSFSLLCFAKIDNAGRPGHVNEQGTLLWIPSDPHSNDLKNKPSAAIWFNQSDKTMHFTVTQEDETMLDLSVDHDSYGTRSNIFSWFFSIPILNSNLEQYPWNSYGLSYNNGILKGYINGVRVGTVTGDAISAYHSEYGMSLGRRDIRTAGGGVSKYRYFLGLMDQMGMHDRALVDSEMQGWHNGVLHPATIMYVRD
ncbi:MAG: LamG domain-containing protein [Candidatus Cloacimonetes bacterium]|nr:LamG domain-containing protein [Candidatus Cloacimonadota bacterium]MCK9241910.1 LamG domain-containing protein [Candidatus Cloacimonadota bacterium]